RPDEPVDLGEALVTLEHRAETLFARAIRIENAIYRSLIPRLVTRCRAHRFVHNRNPVCSKRLYYRTAVPLTVQIRCEKLVDCTLIPGVEINRERRGNPFYFLAPVVEEVSVVDEYPRHPTGVSVGQQAELQPQSTTELPRGEKGRFTRRDDFLGVAHRNH